MMTTPCLRVAALLTLTLAAGPGLAQGVRLGETTARGALYRVSVRVDLSGSLRLPAEKGKREGQEFRVNGQSAIDYDERVLQVGRDGQVERTIRQYGRMDFERKVGGKPQQSRLRREVQRLVILRHKQVEVPFSPDGPLTWGEIDLVRTDVFAPALAGLLPGRAVRPGDRWSASADAVRELTDFEHIEEGSITCRFEQETTLGNRRHARVSFRGAVRGISEDGRSQQQLDGHLYFDLSWGHISYVSMHGAHALLDKDGKSLGKVEGNFVLTRQPIDYSARLADAELRRIKTEPDEENTALLYENRDLGLRFQHPRRWHVAGVRGSQLGLDEKGGSGILLTVEPLKRLPSGAQFARESRQWLEKEKAVIRRAEPVRVIRRQPLIEHFSMDVAVGGQPFRMYYFVLRQDRGGVIVAARLLNRDLAGLERDVQRITASIEVISTK